MIFNYREQGHLDPTHKFQATSLNKDTVVEWLTTFSLLHKIWSFLIPPFRNLQMSVKNDHKLVFHWSVHNSSRGFSGGALPLYSQWGRSRVLHTMHLWTWAHVSRLRAWQRRLCRWERKCVSGTQDWQRSWHDLSHRRVPRSIFIWDLSLRAPDGIRWGGPRWFVANVGRKDKFCDISWHCLLPDVAHGFSYDNAGWKCYMGTCEYQAHAATCNSLARKNFFPTAVRQLYTVNELKHQKVARG